jgi:hypothetical protein
VVKAFPHRDPDRLVAIWESNLTMGLPAGADLDQRNGFTL